ncbi:hypothetical protein FUSO7_10645 [Fusobacterium necrophorum BFTR-2]|nr:hypothetical protein [Fusobacterium necrophorum]KDE70457.1 hypothetical protein FUSO7_10645 [Fusobacterium necrophorum BFTR-2]
MQGRIEKKPADKFNINNLASAKMNPDSEVSADLTDKETEAQYFNSLKYANSLGDGSKKINPEVLKKMRGDTGDITDFISRPDYTIKTIHKEYAESEDGTRKIKLAKETVDKLNKEDLNREYYVRVDGVKKEVLIESVPKADPYTYHLNKSLSQPFEKGLFEYSYDSFQYFIDGKYRESIGEISSAIGGITDPLTLGGGRKLGDEAGRVEAGSIQYGSKEDITEKVEILRDSGRFTGDFIVSSVTTPLLMKGISKGKEIIRKYKNYNLEYSASIAQKATDTYHKTPVQFDEFLIKNGTSYIRDDGRIEYMMKGYVNGKEGIYHITLKEGRTIIHKDFLPRYRWEEFRQKYDLPKYEKIK